MAGGGADDLGTLGFDQSTGRLGELTDPQIENRKAGLTGRLNPKTQEATPGVEAAKPRTHLGGKSSTANQRIGVSPAQTKIVLYQMEGTKGSPDFQPNGEESMRLVFEYAPEEFSEGIDVSWEFKGSHVRAMHPKYKNTAGRVISMTLFLNDWGEDPAHMVQNMTVEERIDWLRSRCYRPDQADPAYKISQLSGPKSPPVMGLVWNQLFLCVIKSVKVTRLKLDPTSLDAIRANVDLELVEWVPEDGARFSTRSDPNSVLRNQPMPRSGRPGFPKQSGS